MPFILNQYRSDQIRILEKSSSVDVVSMVIEIGEDPAIFFHGEDLSDLDMTATNVFLASFQNAVLDRIIVHKSQFEHIIATGPKSILDAVVLDDPESDEEILKDSSPYERSNSYVRPPRIHPSNPSDFVENRAFMHEQGKRSQSLFASVVLGAIDDAIADHKKYGNGPEVIQRWARSRDGQEVLLCAGIQPSERVVSALMKFVSNGVRTVVALDRSHGLRSLFQ